MGLQLRTNTLSQGMSVYIDLLRVVAALLVMVSHYPLTLWIWKVMSATNYAYDAVVLFFVLSGYVISYAAEVLEGSLKRFAVNRIARILPVAFASLVFGGLAFWMFAEKRPEMYGDHSQVSGWLVTVLQSITFVNQVWKNNVTPFANGPYWSLGFEVWCYVFYAAFIYSKGMKRAAIVVLLCIALGPKQIFMLPMWLAGSAAYHMRSRLKLSKTGVACMAILPVLAYFSIQIPLSYNWSYAIVGSKVENIVGFGLDGAANCGWGYMLALLVAIHLFAMGEIFSGVAKKENCRFIKLIRFLSGYTFTLYLFHGLIIKSLLSMTGVARDDFTLAYRLGVYAATFIVVYLIGNVVEHKKYTYRAWANYAIDACSQLFRRSVKV